MNLHCHIRYLLNLQCLTRYPNQRTPSHQISLPTYTVTPDTFTNHTRYPHLRTSASDLFSIWNVETLLSCIIINCPSDPLDNILFIGTTMAHSLVQMLKLSVTLALRSRRRWKSLTNSERRVFSSGVWRKATAPRSMQTIQDSCVTTQDCSRWLQVTESLIACCNILNLKAWRPLIDAACPNFKEHMRL